VDRTFWANAWALVRSVFCSGVRVKLTILDVCCVKMCSVLHLVWVKAQLYIYL